MILSLYQEGGVTVLISSSGGNAGHSVAHIGRKLGIPVKVFVPKTTKPFMIEKIKNQGAQVTIHGENWNEADAQARQEVSLNSGARYIPPFDNPLIFEGHSSIIDELVEYIGPDKKIDEVILSVGGGGLLCGIQLGLLRNGWTSTKIIAVETAGAASFALAKRNGFVSKLDKIDTIASSLGALAVTPITLDSTINTESLVVTDANTVESAVNFLNTHRILVEPACGAALAPVYVDKLRQELYCHKSDENYLEKNIVIIVCGGSAISFDLLHSYRQMFFAD